MSRFGGDGQRVALHVPEPGPPEEMPGAIDRLTVSFRELIDKRDRLEGDVEKFRRRVAEAEDELDQFEVKQLQLSWRPSQFEKQRLSSTGINSAPISAPSVASWTRPRPASGRCGPCWSGSMP